MKSFEITKNFNNNLKIIIDYNLEKLLPRTICNEFNLEDCSDKFVNCDRVNKYLLESLHLKECYSNSIKYLQYFYDEYKSKNIVLSYCEGIATVKKGFVFEHAWIKVTKLNDTGEITDINYIDPTLEICLNESLESINSETYIILKEYSLDSCVLNMLEHKTYGPWYYKNQK